MADDTEWLTIDDLYDALNKTVPKDTIRSWIRTKRLPAYRPGKNYLVRREDFNQFINKSKTTEGDS